jgi:hypothetical protein
MKRNRNSNDNKLIVGKNILVNQHFRNRNYYSMYISIIQNKMYNDLVLLLISKISVSTQIICCFNNTFRYIYNINPFISCGTIANCINV